MLQFSEIAVFTRNFGQIHLPKYIVFPCQKLLPLYICDCFHIREGFQMCTSCFS